MILDNKGLNYINILFSSFTISEFEYLYIILST